MDRDTKNKLTMLIRAELRLFDMGDRVVSASNEKRKALANDRDHSEMWKKAQHDHITRTESGILRQHGNSVRELHEKIITEIQKVVSDFDHSDPALQSALNLINISRKNLPHSVAVSMAEQFRGNPTALKILQPLYAEYGYGPQIIGDILAPLQRLEFSNQEKIDEFLGRATSELVERNTWEPEAVRKDLRSYASALGLDISVNPYRTEIDKLYNESNNPRQQAIIRAYNRRYGDKLSMDDPDAVEEAQRELKNGFTQPII